MLNQSSPSKWALLQLMGLLGRVEPGLFFGQGKTVCAILSHNGLEQRRGY